VHPFVRCGEYDRCYDECDDEQEYTNGRCVAKVAIPEGIVIEIVHDESEAFAGPPLVMM
jgi:hypothetical protein